MLLTSLTDTYWMGQIANYIVKEGKKLTIYYNHWRANSIATDLYLGEKRFLEFVNNCQLKDEIMNEPWIEGCVIIDKSTKSLFFWSFEFSRGTTVVDYYMQQLSKKWGDWNLKILKNRMYDAEKILSIDYVSKQELQTIHRPSTEEIISDKVEEWITTLIIIKQNSSLFITKTGNLNAEKIISYGHSILSLIKNKPKYDLPNEGEKGTYECVLIDEDLKKIYINKSIIGLVETYKNLWTDYDFIIGDFGYIEILFLAGIETSNLVLSMDEVKSQFEEMVQVKDSFNPFEMSEKIKQYHSNVQFNSDFFDNVKPKKTDDADF